MNRRTHIAGLLAFVILLATITPAYAQDDRTEEPPCQPDLSAVISTLEDAQGLMDAGELDAFLSLVETAQGSLDDIRADCAPAPADMTDTETYIAPEGRFTVEYAASLVIQEDSGEPGAVTFATSEAVAESAIGAAPAFEPGQYAINLLVGRGDWFSDETVESREELIDMIRSMAEEIGYTNAPVEETTINDRPTSGFTFEGQDFDGSILVIEVGSGQYGLFITGASSGRIGSVQPIVRQMAESLSVPGAESD